MAGRARQLLDAGNAPAEVLRVCYGVDFPAEFFVLSAMEAVDEAPSALFCLRPWSLIVPLDRGGPPAEPNALDDDQVRVSELDPSAIALLILSGEDYRHGGQLLCYRREDLIAGRSTIIGFRRELEAGTRGRVVGDSLAAVIREHYADNVRNLEIEYASPHNRGAGTLDDFELDGARQNLACAEEFARRAATAP